MQFLKLILQIGSLLLLCVIALLLARPQRRAANSALPTPNSELATDSAWSYTSFKFNGPIVKESYPPKTLYPNLVQYDYQSGNNLETVPAKTNRVFDATDILSKTSADGWQFVWTDGTNYLVRRSNAGHWQHVYFLVNYLPSSE